MPASFQEVFASAGVDQDAKPRPGMIAPQRGSNVVRLVDGAGLRLDAPKTLNIEELQWQGAIMEAVDLPVDILSMLMGSFRPGALLSSRYFRISGATLIGPTPAQVKAVAPGRPTPEAVLDVVVLRRRKVKLSIKSVQVRGPQGGLVNHSKAPFDPQAMVDQMNFIWTLQANVAFELVSSGPVQIVDGAEIAKILGLKASQASLPPMVVLQRFKDLFNRLKDPNADLTMFLVESAGDLADPGALYIHAKPVLGITDPELGISLISDKRTTHRELMAHEAGHYLGSFTGQGGKFVIFGHRGGTSDLMQDGGSDAAKIPFHDVISFFNPP